MSSWNWPSHAADLTSDVDGEEEADTVIAQLQTNGAVIIKGAVQAATCAAALRRVNHRLQRAMAESGQTSTADDPGRGVAATATHSRVSHDWLHRTWTIELLAVVKLRFDNCNINVVNSAVLPTLYPGACSFADRGDEHNSADADAATSRYFGNVASPPHRRDLKLSLMREVKAWWGCTSSRQLTQ
jgi:hypothetical protein